MLTWSHQGSIQPRRCKHVPAPQPGLCSHHNQACAAGIAHPQAHPHHCHALPPACRSPLMPPLSGTTQAASQSCPYPCSTRVPSLLRWVHSIELSAHFAGCALPHAITVPALTQEHPPVLTLPNKGSTTHQHKRTASPCHAEHSLAPGATLRLGRSSPEQLGPT